MALLCCFMARNFCAFHALLSGLNGILLGVSFVGSHPYRDDTHLFSWIYHHFFQAHKRAVKEANHEKRKQKTPKHIKKAHKSKSGKR